MIGAGAHSRGFLALPSRSTIPAHSGRQVGDGRHGFTLLEVMVAMAVLGIAVVAALQLSSQALRLIRVAGEHQDAVHLADRLVRASTPDAEQVDSGVDGAFSWERRVARLGVDSELTTPGLAPPRLFSVSVLVRWGRNQVIELATLRTAPPEGLPRP